jgi:glycosyltransferase involved in cell wall biosynthesis
MSLPKISIVVTNLDLADFLEQTLVSILEQHYPDLELIVVDGGSTDHSVEVIRKYEDRIAWWVSEKDAGQYPAIDKGFARATGEVMAWINSDDLYHPHALEAVGEIFSTFPEVKWLTGFPTALNARSTGFCRNSLPWARWSRWRYYTFDFQFIQQEATFWRREAWLRAGGRMSEELALAGDLELWARMFRHEDLYTTTAILAGFRYRGGDQRSMVRWDEYLAESVSVLRREVARLPLAKRVYASLLRFAILPFSVAWFHDVPALRAVYRVVMGMVPVITYDFEANRWVKGREIARMPPLFVGGSLLSDRLRRKS